MHFLEFVVLSPWVQLNRLYWLCLSVYYAKFWQLFHVWASFLPLSLAPTFTPILTHLNHLLDYPTFYKCADLQKWSLKLPDFTNRARCQFWIITLLNALGSNLLLIKSLQEKRTPFLVLTKFILIMPFHAFLIISSVSFSLAEVYVVL